jgi:hypothetical protein
MQSSRRRTIAAQLAVRFSMHPQLVWNVNVTIIYSWMCTVAVVGTTIDLLSFAPPPVLVFVHSPNVPSHSRILPSFASYGQPNDHHEIYTIIWKHSLFAFIYPLLISVSVNVFNALIFGRNAGNLSQHICNVLIADWKCFGTSACVNNICLCTFLPDNNEWR